jgi:hypothetical protein
MMAQGARRLRCLAVALAVLAQLGCKERESNSPPRLHLNRLGGHAVIFREPFMLFLHNSPGSDILSIRGSSSAFRIGTIALSDRQGEFFRAQNISSSGSPPNAVLHMGNVVDLDNLHDVRVSVMDGVVLSAEIRNPPEGSDAATPSEGDASDAE